MTPLKTLLASKEYADFSNSTLIVEGVFHKVGSVETVHGARNGASDGDFHACRPRQIQRSRNAPSTTSFFLGISERHLLIAHHVESVDERLFDSAAAVSQQLELLKVKLRYILWQIANVI